MVMMLGGHVELGLCAECANRKKRGTLLEASGGTHFAANERLLTIRSRSFAPNCVPLYGTLFVFLKNLSFFVLSVWTVLR